MHIKNVLVAMGYRSMGKGVWGKPVGAQLLSMLPAEGENPCRLYLFFRTAGDAKAEVMTSKEMTHVLAATSYEACLDLFIEVEMGLLNHYASWRGHYFDGFSFVTDSDRELLMLADIDT